MQKMGKMKYKSLISLFTILVLALIIHTVTASIYYYPQQDVQKHYETITTTDTTVNWNEGYRESKTTQKSYSYDTTEVIALSNDWYRPYSRHCVKVRNYDHYDRWDDEDYWRYHYKGYRWEDDRYSNCYDRGSCYRPYQRYSYYRCWYD